MSEPRYNETTCPRARASRLLNPRTPPPDSRTAPLAWRLAEQGERRLAEAGGDTWPPPLPAHPPPDSRTAPLASLTLAACQSPARAAASSFAR